MTLAGFVLLGLLAYHLIVVVKEATRDRLYPSVPTLKDATNGDARFPARRYGSAQRVPGNRWLEVPLLERAAIDSGASVPTSSEIANYLYVDRLSRESKWVFQNRSAIIRGRTFVFEQPAASQGGVLPESAPPGVTPQGPSPVKSILLDAVVEDTSGDGRLGLGDSRSLFLVSLETFTPVTVAIGVTELMAVEQLSATELLLLFVGRDGPTSLLVDLRSGLVIREQRLPEPNR